MKKYLFGLGAMNRVILFLIACFWLGGCSVSGVGYGLTAATHRVPNCGGPLTLGNFFEGVCFCERELMKPDQLAINFPDHDEVIEKIKKVNSFMRQKGLCPKSDGVHIEGVVESLGYPCTPGPNKLYRSCLRYGETHGGPSKANFGKWIMDGNLEKAWVGCKDSWLGEEQCHKFIYGDQPKFN